MNKAREERLWYLQKYYSRGGWHSPRRAKQHSTWSPQTRVHLIGICLVALSLAPVEKAND
jgi:hypothetical protein